MPKVSCVDLFCGAGGLTHGFVLEGLPVVAGIDLDPACRFPYEANNDARFVERDISKVTTKDLKTLFGDADVTILAGCAPCQPFSTYAQRYELDGKDGKWGLLYEFARLAKGSKPDVITMENVPTVARHEVFHDFVDTLKRLGYTVWFDVVDSSRLWRAADAAPDGAAGVETRRHSDDRTHPRETEDGSSGDWPLAPTEGRRGGPKG